MRRLPRFAAAALCTMALAGCPRAKRPPLEPLEAAAAAVRVGSGQASDLALAAWHAWLTRSDAAELEKLATRAAQADPAQPWALFALAETAGRRARLADEAAALLALLERTPGHPLAVPAASRLVELTGTSPALDDELDRRATAALAAGGLPHEAAIRLREAQREIRANRGEPLADVVAAAGLIDHASLVGPFSPYHALDVATPFPPEQPPLAATYSGPAGIGPLALRVFDLPIGLVSLHGDSAQGDVTYALAVAEVPAQARYVVRAAVSRGTTLKVLVDGLPLLERDVSSGTPLPRILARAVDMPAGRHLVAVRIVRGRGRGDVQLSLAPLDGSPSQVRFRAAVAGDVPGTPPALDVSPEELPAAALAVDARSLAAALEPEVGVLAAYVGAQDGTDVDRNGAKEMLATLFRELPATAPLLVVRAERTRADGSLPGKIAAARSAGDNEEAARLDPGNSRALLRWAAALRRAGRHDDALERIEAAEKASPGTAGVALARARVELARGFDLLALAAAREAAGREPGRCGAGELLHDLARRSETPAETAAVARDYVRCPGGRARLASLLKERGELETALELAQQLLAQQPDRPDAALRVADVLLAMGRPQDAARVVARLEGLRPRNPQLPRRRAELLERAGDRTAAREARARTLQLDGSDLSLRRALALDRGTDLLADVDVDGLEAIRAFEASGRSFDTKAVILLDFGAVEAYADGSAVERTHTVAKVLDKRGIDEYGEVHLPVGAEVIRLRTIKRDGRILEPEAISEKESISLPGLEVGDYVEYEYLAPLSSRGPALHGWSASPFFFRVPEVPLLDSFYFVRAEREAGLVVDAHNGIEVPAPAEQGGLVQVQVRRRDNAALVAEPKAPNRYEFLPWVQVGAGAGEEQLALYYADTLADAANRSFEVERWARTAAGEAEGVRARVQAVYERASAEITSAQAGRRDDSFAAAASEVLAQKKGNRALLVKAALDTLGIETRFAVVRTFDENPVPYRFPRFDRWSFVALAARDPAATGDAEWIWLDPGTRWAPFDLLPEGARGVPAYLLPGPGGGPTRLVTTPSGPAAADGREIQMDAALGRTGELTGTATETYLGYDAAVARSYFEQLNQERRRQMVESALAKTFKGLTLEELQIQLEGPAGSPVKVQYRFRVPGFARELGGNRSGVDLGFFAANLGRRFLQRGARETPLLVGGSDSTRTTIRLELPPGARVKSAPGPAAEKSAFGEYQRAVRQQPDRLELQESLLLSRGRVSPQQYPEFARWAAAVDRAQRAELELVR